MVEILKAPDIVNPFGVKSFFLIDGTSSHDLSLDVLLRNVSFEGNGYSVAENVLKRLTKDHETVTYRQDVLQELISNEELRESVHDFTRKVQTLDKRLNKFENYSNLKKGLKLLREYILFVNDPPDLDSANSKALQEVYAYSKKVRDYDVFKETCELVERIENLGGVNFSVSLDKDGRPVSMSAFELIERKEEKLQESRQEEKSSFLQRILRRRKKEPKVKYEQKEIERRALIERNDYDSNRLSQEIYWFIDNQFASVIEEYLQQIKEVVGLKNQLNYYLGFSEYFVKLREKGFDISRPTLLPKEERRTVVVNAKNLTIVARRSNGREIIPNDIKYDPNENMFVITGPNNGGKTTYVKTAGLIQILAQSGLFVPAESAEISLIDGIYTHFIAPDDITKGEGRYRNELLRMKYILEHASPFSLVILDEPCGGTSYEEGQKQSLFLLDGFHKLGTTTFFTTHMHPVTKEVENGRFTAARNLSVDCVDDGEKLIYTFRIKSGASGKSYGEEIAREIGLRPENIDAIISNGAEVRKYSHLLRNRPLKK